MLKIKKWYIDFLEKEKNNISDKTIFLFFIFLSFLYTLIIGVRNFLYDSGILKIKKCPKKIISIGNLSWAGSGKTSLASFLYHKLSPQIKSAVLRRGYGKDEERLLGEKNIQVFSSRNRVALANGLSDKFDLFILDDGFQYRKLYRDINIVIMGAREFRNKIRLLPASFFREPLSSLKRANILVVNYKEEMTNVSKTVESIKFFFKNLSVYTASYKFDRITDLQSKEINLKSLRNKKLAAVTAIGYPQGFLNKLKESQIEVAKSIVYPDHYELDTDEFNSLEENLIANDIYDVIITAKDKYHLPNVTPKLNFYILEVALRIDSEEEFLKEIKIKLK